MYRLKSKVRYSEANLDNELSYYGLLNYLQDTSILHSEELGENSGTLREQNMAWILSFWQICIIDMPKRNDEITVSTWSYSTKSLFGLRNFCIEDAQGKTLVKANSIWVLLNLQSKRAMRITDEVRSYYPDEPKLDMDYCDRKLLIPKEYKEEAAIVVPNYFIDTNNHVNNAKYVMIAEEYLPADFKAREIRVEYKKAAVLGDVMIPRVTITEDTATIVFVDAQGSTYAVVVFLRRNDEILGGLT